MCACTQAGGILKERLNASEHPRPERRGVNELTLSLSLSLSPPRGMVVRLYLVLLCYMMGCNVFVEATHTGISTQLRSSTCTAVDGRGRLSPSLGSPLACHDGPAVFERGEQPHVWLQG